MNRDYAEMRAVAQGIKEKSEDFSKILATIKNLNNELIETWKGADATKYTSAINEQATTMESLKDVIFKTSEYLEQVASAYEQVENDIANSINI